MVEKWQVQTDQGLYEYDGYASVIGGALCIFLENGDRQYWGPSSWEWAKCEKAKI